MWNENSKFDLKLQTGKVSSEKKVIDMRAWLDRKREAAKNVLIFTPRNFVNRNFVNNDQPPSVA